MMYKVVGYHNLLCLLVQLSLYEGFQYVRDESFARGFAFKDVTDIAVNPAMDHVLVLQRSQPPVTVWTTEGSLLFSWNTSYLGFPHSITLNGTDPGTATVWITDMAGELKAGKVYGHCIKKFNYYGKFLGAIGKCDEFSEGSKLNPIQFDKVTDIAINLMGHYYIADGDITGLNNRVLVLNRSMDLIDVWNKENKIGSESMQFNLPHAISVDACDRVWVADTQNHRIQVINHDGKYLGELSFGDSSQLIYGLDFMGDDSVVLTTRNPKGNSEVLIVPIAMDCTDLQRIGESKLAKKLILSLPEGPNNTMLHSVTVEPKSLDIYMSVLPGSTPPLKFIRAKESQKSNHDHCGANPPGLPPKWATTVLLTPFQNSKLATAKVEYDSSKMSMYVVINDPSHGQQEYLIVKSSTYLVTRDSGTNTVSCHEQTDKIWSVPTPEWLNSHQCTCRGDIESMGVVSVLWECPLYSFVNWFWFKQPENMLWRIFLNNKTNPIQLPVLGDYTMVSFSTEHNSDTKQLEEIYDTCIAMRDGSSYRISSNNEVFSLSGFSYSCSNNLPSWPVSFYLTATMLPVNYYEPLPTEVIYYWKLESQKTVMHATGYNYDAYLIRNKTYIVNEYRNGTVKCIQSLNFGPPVPNWMNTDNCQCMGTLSNSSLLNQLWHPMTIAVCPLGDRVFWVWYGTANKYRYQPGLFFETLAPSEEGTSLSFANYHSFYPGQILIDLSDFQVPEKCKF